VAPVGPVYQAGTLSANPLAMRAGLATLQQLADGSVYARLDALCQRLADGLRGAQHLSVQRCESLFWVCASASGAPALPMRTTPAFPADAGRCYTQMFHPLLERGYYLAPSGFEVGFLAASHTEAHVDGLAAALMSLQATL
jgi:glutamate-1-semialdehyde 2,1-aminomutase